MVEDVKADIVASQFRPQIQRASLFVTILDVNDNNPEFKEKLYKVMIFVAAALDASPTAAIRAPIIVTTLHP